MAQDHLHQQQHKQNMKMIEFFASIMGKFAE